MGEKVGKGGEEKQKKPESGPTTVVMKVDFHCEGCAQKVKRSIKRVDGVESVSADMASNKLTVEGKVDPVKLKEMVEEKTKKKVEIVSSAVNAVAKPKGGGGDAKNPAAAGGGAKEENTGKKDEIISPSNKAAAKLKDSSGDAKKPASTIAGGGGAKKVKTPAEEKKPKMTQSSTIVLKIPLHCEGCIQSIRKKIYKVKGVEAVSVDAGKDLVTVKGTMDPKALPAILKDKLKRGVEVIPTEKSDNAGGHKKESGDRGDGKKEGGDGEKKKDGGGGEKKKEGAGGDDSVKEGGKAVEVNKMEYCGVPYGYQVEMAHAPQIFSDENPNACSIM